MSYTRTTSRKAEKSTLTTKNEKPEFEAEQAADGPAHSTDAAPKDDAAHLDGFTMPDIDAGAMDEDGPINNDAEFMEDVAPGDDILDPEAFWQVFQTAFHLPGVIDPRLAPLAIAPGEKTRARAASDGVYGLLKIYYPAALMPQSETLAHVFAAAPFFMAKAMIVRDMIRASKARPVDQPEEPAKPQPGASTPAADHLPIIIDQDGEAAAEGGA